MEGCIWRVYARMQLRCTHLPGLAWRKRVRKVERILPAKVSVWVIVLARILAVGLLLAAFLAVVGVCLLACGCAVAVRPVRTTLALALVFAVGMLAIVNLGSWQDRPIALPLPTVEGDGKWWVRLQRGGGGGDGRNKL